MFMYITECQEDRGLTIKVESPLLKMFKDVLNFPLWYTVNFRKPCDEKERTQVKPWRSACQKIRKVP